MIETREIMKPRTTFNISFQCRESKVTKKGVAPVEMVVNLNGKRFIFSLTRKEEPIFFKKAMKSKKDNPIKEYTKEAYNDIQMKIFEMQRNKIPLNVENLKIFIRNGFCNDYTIESMFKEYFEILEEKVKGGMIQKGVYGRYLKSAEYFYLHGADKNTQAEDITTAEIAKFTAWLESNYENSTAIGLYKKIKTMFNFAFSAGRIKSNPTAGIKINKTTKQAVFLTEDELSKIENTDFENDSLNHYRDIFIFQCHTCLSYVDLKNLKKEDIKESEFGKYIQKKRQKTGISFTIRLDTTAQFLLEKYDYDLDIKSMQKYNTYLKHIAKIAGIDKNITTHTARHTGATMLLNNGTPKEIVQNVLGHSNLSQVETYAKMLDTTTLQNLAHLEERMEQRHEDAEKQRRLQEEKVRLKKMLSIVYNLPRTEEHLTEEEIDNIIDSTFAEEPFDGSLKRDIDEYNLQFGEK